jgi:hypothetical protein
MIFDSELARVMNRVLLAAVAVLSMVGCQTNPMFWSDGTKVEVRPDGTFVVSLASEKLSSLGGPGSANAQEFILASLRTKGCVPTVPIEKGENAWGGYWYATGKCK